MKHTLKADGAAFSADAERVNPGSAAGEGSALCACGWVSEVLPTRAARIAAHRVHKAHPGEYVQDESVESVEEPMPDLAIEGLTEQESGDFLEALESINESDPTEVTRTYDFVGSIYSADFADLGVARATARGLQAVRARIKDRQRAHQTVVTGPEHAVDSFLRLLPALHNDCLVAHAKWQKENQKSLHELPRNDRHRANRAFIAGWGQDAAKQVSEQ